jgi:hypothetical protein
MSDIERITVNEALPVDHPTESDGWSTIIGGTPEEREALARQRRNELQGGGQEEFQHPSLLQRVRILFLGEQPIIREGEITHVQGTAPLQ